MTSEIPAQKTSNAENVSIWWCHHVGTKQRPCDIEYNLYCQTLNYLNKWLANEIRLRIIHMVLLQVLDNCDFMLTHWGRDKMDTTSQTTCSSAFSSMKMYECWLKFHWSFFLRFQLTISKVPINNIKALVQIMAWCRPGDKPLSDPMLVSLPTHLCFTRPQWVNP